MNLLNSNNGTESGMSTKDLKMNANETKTSKREMNEIETLSEIYQEPGAEELVNRFRSILRDLENWNTELELMTATANMLESGSSSKDQRDSIKQAPEAFKQETTPVTSLNFITKKRVHEFASRVGNLCKDFEKEIAILLPAKPKAENGTKESPTKLVSINKIPEETDCTVDNWKDFLPYINPEERPSGDFEAFKFDDDGPDLEHLPIALVYFEEEPTIRIYSPYLQQVMRKVVDVEKCLDVAFFSTCISIVTPFRPMYHYLDEMKSIILADGLASKSDKNYFMALCHFFETGPTRRVFEDVKTEIRQGIIFYDDLWALFKPNDYCISRDSMGNHSISQISSIKWEEDPDSRAVIRYRWFLNLTRINWVQGKFQRRISTIRLEAFAGPILIQDMSFYPLDYYHPKDDIDRLKRESIECGKNWASFCAGNPKVMSFSGNAIKLNNGAGYGGIRSSSGKLYPTPTNPMPVKCSVVVDRDGRSKLFKQAGIDGSTLIDEPELHAYGTGPKNDDIEVEVFAEEDYLICPMVMTVFNLDDNEWYLVNIVNLSPRLWRPEAIDRLVFDITKKTVIKHLAGSNSSRRDRYSRDVIEGKGKGTVLLLHGPPGVGKTMTAEVISESTRKPLLKVHLGKVANNPNWEQALEQIFSIAEDWEAILLIDEAEIVLEKRTFERMTQNSWISVFLRKLEYYKGLIILTTNMINNIDEAFESRISYPVEFHELCREDRRIIWQDFIKDIKMLPAYKKDLITAVDEWSEAEINGRQIRNIISIAENLAASDELGGRLTCAHIDDILNVTLAFSSHNRNSIAKKKRDQFVY